MKDKLLKAWVTLDTITSMDLRKLVLEWDSEVLRIIEHMKHLVEEVAPPVKFPSSHSDWRWNKPKDTNSKNPWLATLSK